MFKKDQATAIVYRLWYTTVGWYKQSWYTATWDSYKGHLKALTLKDWVEIWNFWKEFQFNTDVNSDIKESDRLEINWENYDVKWVASFEWVSFSRKMFILNKV